MRNNGVSRNLNERLVLKWACGEATASGNTTVVTPATGKKLHIGYLSYNPLTATQCAFRFGASGDLFLMNRVMATGIVAKDFGDLRYMEGGVNEALILNLGDAVSTLWNVFYVEVYP
jgi:hypothetical protein